MLLSLYVVLVCPCEGQPLPAHVSSVGFLLELELKYSTHVANRSSNVMFCLRFITVGHNSMAYGINSLI